MTDALEEAIAAVKALSAAEQDAIAAIILDELTDEHRWEQLFAKSAPKLAQMAEKARQDMREGRVREAGFDEL